MDNKSAANTVCETIKKRITLYLSTQGNALVLNLDSTDSLVVG
jgi:hypothetical protein